MPELRLGPREVPVIPGPSSGRSLGLFMRYGRKTYCDLDVNWSHASHSLEIYPGGGGSRTEKLSFNLFGVATRMGYKLISRPGFHGRLQTGPQLGRAITGPSPGSGARLRDKGWNWQIGAGIDLFHFNIDLGYNIGLRRLSNPALPEKFRLNMWALELGMHL